MKKAHYAMKDLVWHGVIAGEPCSKSNTHRLSLIPRVPLAAAIAILAGAGGHYLKKLSSIARPMERTSKDAEDYKAAFLRQVLTCRPAVPMEGVLRSEIVIYYRDYRKDVDHSLIHDCLQACGIIKNDRWIRSYSVRGEIDKSNPRAEIFLYRES